MAGIQKQHEKYAVKSSVSGEKNDCHVRAFSLALGISYEESHRLHSEAGRKNGSGTPWSAVCKLTHDFNLKNVTYENCKYGQWQFPTLKQFIWDHPKGTFIMYRRGHAFVLIDGVVHDWMHGTGPRSHIVKAVKVKD